MLLRQRGSLFVLSLLTLVSASGCDPADSTTEPQNRPLVLSTGGPGSGTVAASPAGNADGAYMQGTAVTITATASSGSDFTGWNEVDAPGCREPKNPCAITMDDRKTVVANFAPSAGVARFDGLYTGDINQATPGTHPLNLTIVNGVVQGKVAPMYGSLGTFTGTLDETGKFDALVNAQSGPQFTCQTRLAGTVTTSLVDGIMTATLNATFHAESVPGSICGAGTPLPSGTWVATRDRIHVDKL
jgi:hypothetical protein